jgi:hypothetical protein
MVSHSETKVRLYQRRIATHTVSLSWTSVGVKGKQGLAAGETFNRKCGKGGHNGRKENLARDTMGSRIAYNSASV